MYSNRSKVSIGVPVHNGASHIAEALDSVLNQTHQDFEVVICDNCSTDETEEICRGYATRDARITYQRNDRNRGLAWNYNRTFQLSSGEYFKWVPHDDLLEPPFLEVCVDALDRDPGVTLAVSRVRLIDEDGSPADFQERLRRYIHGRGLHQVPVERAQNLSSPDPVKRFTDIVRHKVWFYELYGVIRSRDLRRTDLLGPYVGSCQVLLAELALLGRFVQLPEELYLNRFPYFYASDPRAPELALKMDPHWSARVNFPQANAALGYLRAARSAPIALSDRVRCLGVLAAKVFEPDNIAKLVIPGPNNYLGLDVTKLWRRSSRNRAAPRSPSGASGDSQGSPAPGSGNGQAGVA